MAIVPLGDGQYVGMYADTRPTAPLGWTLREMDTGDVLVSDGTFWWLTGPPGPMSPRRWGAAPQGAATTTGIGMIPATTAATGTGTVADVVTDATNGKYRSFPTGTVTGDNGGQRVAVNNFTARHHSPRMRFKFQLPASGDFTLSRLWIGWGNNAEPAGDDAFNAVSACCIGLISGGTNFIILRNDGSGATNVADNVAGSAQALDTSVHTVSIVADEANTRFGVKWDANAYVFVNTDIPAATTSIVPIFQNETNESGVAKTFRLWNLQIQAEK